jgi:hypothetical protein
MIKAQARMIEEQCSEAQQCLEQITSLSGVFSASNEMIPSVVSSIQKVGDLMLNYEELEARLIDMQNLKDFPSALGSLGFKFEINAENEL